MKDSVFILAKMIDFIKQYSIVLIFIFQNISYFDNLEVCIHILYILNVL